MKKNFAAVTLVALSMAACQEERDTQGARAAEPASVDAQGSLHSAGDVAPALKVSGLSIGRYIEDKTFKVGGDANTFKPSDSIFVGVTMEGSVPLATIQVRILDVAGKLVAEETKTLISSEQKIANFAMKHGTSPNLGAGTYKVEVLVDSEPALSGEFVVAE